MYDNALYDEEEQWVIWNSAYGIVDTVTLGRVEHGLNSSNAWLSEPYDMVGPFSLNELEENGQIYFAACTVMSRHRWKMDQVRLRQESLKKRRESQRLFEERIRENSNKRVRPSRSMSLSETQCRMLLNLPVSGVLKSSQIKMAYRKLVKKTHPDVGGSQEAFVQMTQARDVLLECFAK